eukprot:Hpha_TRINITY_DN15231_c1_g23::TRINITY_DN15231_c1_g23_i1::g.67700::m.67700
MAAPLRDSRGRRVSGSPEPEERQKSGFEDRQKSTNFGGTVKSLGGTRKSGGGGGGGESSNVRVMVRVRPFSNQEVEYALANGQYLQSVIDMPRSDQVEVLDHQKDYIPMKAFNFDSVLWSIPDHQQRSPCGFADQERVYIDTGAIALDAAWEGMNSCIFAYGQTGSGKTHTMMGDPAQIAGGAGCADDQLGLIPRLCRQLVNESNEKKENAGRVGIRKTVEFDVTFIEIYNEQVKDLLVGAPGKFFVHDAPKKKDEEKEKEKKGTYEAPLQAAQLFRRDSGGLSKKKDEGLLQVREHPTEGPQVAGACIYQPSSYEDIIELINFGNGERHVAETKMNDRSSRSHAMFRITLRQISHLEVERAGIGGPKVETSERHANLNLVDLAGSENTKRSGVKGATMKEAQNINLSLTTLRRCIDALIEKKSQQSIPYRDSTLTWLLRQNLGGNSKCFMLATVSPHHLNSHTSMQTLEYAMRARAIVNQVRVNEDDTAKMLRDLEKRLEEKQRALLEECATSEERSELVKELADAQHYRDAMQERIADMNRQWEEQQRQLEKVRAEKTIGFLRHAGVFRAQAKELDEVSKVAQKQQTELHRFNEAAQSAGHTDIDAMASSLLTNRQEIDQLLRQAEKHRQEQAKLQEKERKLEKQHELELAELHNRIERLLSEQRAEKERAGANLAEVKAAEDNRVSELASWYEQKMAAMKERHNDQIQKSRDEADELLSKIQQEKDLVLNRKITGMQQQLEQHRREVRTERAKAEERMRAVQNAEMKLRQKLSDLRVEREQLDREMQLLRDSSGVSVADLSQRCQNETHRAEKLEAQIEEIEAKIKLDAELAAETAEELQAAARAAGAEAARDRSDLNRVKTLLAKREQACDQLCNKSLELLAAIESGKLPAGWTIGDFKEMVRTLGAFRMAAVATKSSTHALTSAGYARPPQLASQQPNAFASQSVDVGEDGGKTAADGVNVGTEVGEPVEEPDPVPPPKKTSSKKRQSPSTSRTHNRSPNHGPAPVPATARTTGARSQSRTSGAASARSSSRTYGSARKPVRSTRTSGT